MRVYIVKSGARILKVVGQKALAKYWTNYYRSIFVDTSWEEFIIERKEQRNGKSASTTEDHE